MHIMRKSSKLTKKHININKQTIKNNSQEANYISPNNFFFENIAKND